MSFSSEFSPLKLADIPSFAKERKQGGWHFVQVLACKTDAGFDVIYTFMKDGLLSNHIVAITKTDEVPSITNDFLAAFVFENEMRELFGIKVSNIAIDFAGKLYTLSEPEPMSVISPAQKEAREKAAKIQAAKAAKMAKEQKNKEAEKNGASAAALPKENKIAAGAASANETDIEAKLAGLDPEKAAKVRAALEAKAAKAKAKKSENEKEGE